MDLIFPFKVIIYIQLLLTACIAKASFQKVYYTGADSKKSLKPIHFYFFIYRRRKVL